jgi:hypothetical protein
VKERCFFTHFGFRGVFSECGKLSFHFSTGHFLGADLILADNRSADFLTDTGRMRDEIEGGDSPRGQSSGTIRIGCGRVDSKPGHAAGAGGIKVIRQAISCDICGNEKKQTNHWFVAYEQGGELRVAGWSSRNRLRPGTRHLCGQTCLHKLVDDYMARAIGQKTQNAPHTKVEASTTRADASLTSRGAHNSHAANDDVEFESSARLITATFPILPIPATRPTPELVAAAGKQRSDCVIPLPEEPRYASRNLRAEAWERERERETHGQDCRTDLTRRRANGR